METQVSARSTGLNEAVVHGQLVAEPETRTLPSGSSAVSFSLTVRSPGVKTTSVPVVWYDPPVRIAQWAIGDMVVVRGPVVRRFFQGGRGLGSSTEVVVEQAQLARHGTRAQTLLDNTKTKLVRLGELVGRPTTA